MKGPIAPPPNLARSYSSHAIGRTRSRALPYPAVLAALDWGTETPVARGRSYWLTSRAIRYARRHGVDVTRFRGVRVITTHTGDIVTVYRRR